MLICAMDAVSTKHTHQSHYGGGDEGVVKTYHSVDNIFYERGSQLEDWQLKHTGEGSVVDKQSKNEKFWVLWS